MARKTYTVPATEPWEAAAALATVLDFSVNPVAIHDDHLTVEADADDPNIVATIRGALAAA